RGAGELRRRVPSARHGRRAGVRVDDRDPAAAAARSVRTRSAGVRRRWPSALLVALGVGGLFAIPTSTANEYVLALGVSFATFAVLSGGLNLVYGYTGLLSFAQVGFFGIGGYTAALLVV